ncbi:MAG: 2Fe-2S iron-sulfur cluster binding domain-containing protein [Firmicutes bacterium]|nr:2Fe-2S iron-sulfur cluster binding domain-containing protein [Bacillota bacterium]
MNTIPKKEYLTLAVHPWELKLRYLKGKNLMRVLNEAGIYFKYSCGGDGACGRCKIEVAEQDRENYQELLSCKISLIKNAKVKVPPQKVVVDF